MPEYEFDAIGTRWQITTAHPLPAAVRAAVHAQIEEYDRALSRFRGDSAVSELARNGGSAALPAYVGDLVALYRTLETLTNGAVNPLVGRSMEALGYDAAYTLRPTGATVAAPAMGDAVTYADGVLRVTEPVLIDVGAIGKGQLVDLVAQILGRARLAPFIVDAGGDLFVSSGHDEPVRVGLEDPADAGRVIGALPVDGRAVCGSAPNRRQWGKGLHHIIDARSGAPLFMGRGAIATWGIADSAAVADAAASALFSRPPRPFRRHSTVSV